MHLQLSCLLRVGKGHREASVGMENARTGPTVDNGSALHHHKKRPFGFSPSTQAKPQRTTGSKTDEFPHCWLTVFEKLCCPSQKAPWWHSKLTLNLWKQIYYNTLLAGLGKRTFCQMGDETEMGPLIRNALVGKYDCISYRWLCDKSPAPHPTPQKNPVVSLK